MWTVTVTYTEKGRWFRYTDLNLQGATDIYEYYRGLIGSGVRAVTKIRDDR